MNCPCNGVKTRDSEVANSTHGGVTNVSQSFITALNKFLRVQLQSGKKVVPDGVMFY